MYAVLGHHSCRVVSDGGKARPPPNSGLSRPVSDGAYLNLRDDAFGPNKLLQGAAFGEGGGI